MNKGSWATMELSGQIFLATSKSEASTCAARTLLSELDEKRIIALPSKSTMLW